MDRQPGRQPVVLMDDSSSGSSPEAVVPLRPRIAPRTKRWTARARTGCNTCRTRHVKCDEQRPVCKQCIFARRECTGYSYGNDIGVESAFPMEAPVHPTKGLDPIDWDFQEACRYYVEVQAPMSNYTEVGANSLEPAYDAVAELRKGRPEPYSFTAMVLQHRIICSSIAAKVKPQNGTLNGMSHLWNLLYECMAMSVKNLNGYIKVGMRPSYIFAQTVNMLGIEVGVSMPTWRLHAEGLAALIKGYGGMENLKTMIVPAFLAVQYGFILSTACNTTSPPSNQIVGVTDWSRNEVRLAYSHTGRETFPCPTDLFFELIEITRLRTAVHTGDLSRTQLLRNARKIAKAIEEFDPESWTETYDTEDPSFTKLAQLFKSAITLYAVLSLPPRLVKPFTVPQQPVSAGSGTGGAHAISAHAYYRDQLFQLFTASWDVISRQSLGWPVAVLGVAVADSPVQREQLRAWLDHLCWIQGTDCGTLALVPLLEEFWASGNTKWDDCFYEPINCLL